MPRLTKRTDLICELLEIATSQFSFLTHIDEPTVQRRIQQAIDRHPDLEKLLRPALEELKQATLKEYKAKAAVSTAKSLIKNNEPSKRK